jgi:hypothetical protein
MRHIPEQIIIEFYRINLRAFGIFKCPQLPTNTSLTRTKTNQNMQGSRSQEKFDVLQISASQDDTADECFATLPDEFTSLCIAAPSCASRKAEPELISSEEITSILQFTSRTCSASNTDTKFSIYSASNSNLAAPTRLNRRPRSVS